MLSSTAIRLRSMRHRELLFAGFGGVMESADPVDGAYHVPCVKN